MIADKTKLTKRELRKFGLTLGLVFGLIGVFLLWQQKETFLYFIVSAAVLSLLGIIAPTLLLYLYKIWMSIARAMSWFNTRVILSIIFFLILTPIALIMRLFGKQFIELRWDKSVRSYWNYRESSVTKRADYEKQF